MSYVWAITLKMLLDPGRQRRDLTQRKWQFAGASGAMKQVARHVLIGLKRAGHRLFPLSLASLVVAFVTTVRADRLNEAGLPYLYPRQPYSLEDLPSCHDKDRDRTVVAGGRFLQCYPGNIDGMKLLIPNYFLLSYPEYDGRSWLSREPLNLHPTFENKISNFAIRLRSSTLLPVVTENDYRELSNPSINGATAYGLWIDIGFDPSRYPPDGSLRSRLEFELQFRDQFELAGTAEGLRRYEGKRYSKASYEANEVPEWRQVFADDLLGTVISCKDEHYKRPPYESFRICRHYFVIPEARMLAKGTLWEGSFERWKSIETRAKEIVSRLVVR